MSNNKPLVEYRKEIYGIVERILNRTLTKDEHAEIKASIMSCIEGQRTEIDNLNKALQVCGRKRKNLAMSMYKIGKGAEIIEGRIAFLRKEFEENHDN